MTVWTIVLAAGSGERFGGTKQFERLGDRRLVDWPVGSARETSEGVVVVVPAGHQWSGVDVEGVVAGGATHGDSVRAGLAAVPDEADVIVVATAVHPLASVKLIASLIDAVRRGADASAPAVASADAIKRVRDGVVVASVDKSDLVIIQAPSAFRAHRLRDVLATGADAPEELELIERAGGTVVTIPGEPTNIHIATPADLALAQHLLTPPPTPR